MKNYICGEKRILYQVKEKLKMEKFRAILQHVGFDIYI